MLKEWIKKILREILPIAIRQKLAEVYWRQKSIHPPVGKVNFGDLRRLTPINRLFGRWRGQGIDRYYIENFISQHCKDIKGEVLEIGDDRYSKKFGGNKIKHLDILHKTNDNPKTTIVADLSQTDNIPSNKFDCIIFTQTLQFIYETRLVLQTLERILKPGGVLLMSFPGISQIVRYDMEKWGDYWRFTSLSAHRVLEEFFPPENLKIKVYGNVLTAVAFLHGLSSEELNSKELNYQDKDYELIILVRAQKPYLNSKTK